MRDADITKLEVDAIANAANTDLRHGGGVAAMGLGAKSLALVVFTVHGAVARDAFERALA